MIRHLVTAAVVAALGLSSNAYATLLSDDFEVDSSASYTVIQDATPDSTATFAFDYIAAGIPLAPNSAPGDTGGLRMTANDTLGASDAITAFHNTAVTGSPYKLTVDVYMGVQGTGGTTEYMHVGVAGDGATVNSLFLPITGSGHFLAVTGEGGSSSDFRHSRPAAIGGLTNTGDLSYLNSDNTTNATGDTYQDIFSNANGYSFAGSPGNNWATLEVLVTSGLIQYSFNGTPIIRNEYSAADGDLISLGYGDLFSSLATPFQSQFVIYDNLSVVAVPEPSTALLSVLGLVGFVARRNR
ncbi:hypothetical protein MalM25_15410 [Planctomycetes bacterium MalM25]|nr:hypothetical protein MalM25_15410 [Planctomycetes bacterium MalM25]